MIIEAELVGLPWGAAHLIINTLRNEKCTSDHVLLLADAVEEWITQLPPVSHYIAACRTTVTRLREVAPEFSQRSFDQGDTNAANNE